ncbi:MAG TPA: TolC family protein [Cyclobacteriaceae bacterium]|jgi:cobalt-zinc-cadmium resistance protein CzcA|nr:TolC family protein [Cyclobacteriaceae bacterium]
MKIFKILICFSLAFYSKTLAQQNVQQLRLGEALSMALRNNASIKASEFDIETNRSLKRTASDIGKTSFSGTFGQYNSYVKSDNNITISQSIPFPTTFNANAKLGAARVRSSELMLGATQNELAFQVKSSFYQLAYLKTLDKWLLHLDSIYVAFQRAATLRYQYEETNLIEKTTAETQAMQIRTQLRQNDADIRIFQTRLQTLLNTNESLDIQFDSLTAREVSLPDTSSLVNNPLLSWFRQQIMVAERQKTVEKNRLLPDLSASFFSQTLIDTQVEANSPQLATASNRFQGFGIGIAIPLWIKPQAARVKAAQSELAATESMYAFQEKNFQGRLNELIQDYLKYSESLRYYLEASLPNAELLLNQSQRAYESGEIGYVEYLQSLRTATEVRTGYLATLNNYNQAVISIEYVIGQQ